jgi:hypothetical protein
MCLNQLHFRFWSFSILERVRIKLDSSILSPSECMICCRPILTHSLAWCFSWVVHISKNTSLPFIYFTGILHAHYCNSAHNMDWHGINISNTKAQPPPQKKTLNWGLQKGHLDLSAFHQAWFRRCPIQMSWNPIILRHVFHDFQYEIYQQKKMVCYSYETT